MATSKNNRDMLTAMIRAEVDKAVGRMGFVREDELAALQLVSTYTKAEDIPADQQSELPYALARPFLFGLDPEAAHDLTLTERLEEPVDDEAFAALVDHHIGEGLLRAQSRLRGRRLR